MDHPAHGRGRAPIYLWQPQAPAARAFQRRGASSQEASKRAAGHSTREESRGRHLAVAGQP
jgi:hypothetical protein